MLLVFTLGKRQFTCAGSAFRVGEVASVADAATTEGSPFSVGVTVVPHICV